MDILDQFRRTAERNALKFSVGRPARAELVGQGFVRLVSIPGAVMYGHDDGRCATIDSEGEVKRYATREEMARALLQE